MPHRCTFCSRTFRKMDFRRSQAALSRTERLFMIFMAIVYASIVAPGVYEMWRHALS